MFIHSPLTDIWAASGSGLLQMKLLQIVICGHLPFLLSKHSGMEWNDGSHASVYLTLKEMTESFSKVLGSFTFLVCQSSSAFTFLPTFALPAFTSLGAKWYFIEVFHLQIPNYDYTEHLFTCLFTVHISSLLKYLFKSFARF